MNKQCLFKLLLLFHICFTNQAMAVEFVVVIPSYNNQQWYQKNLDSVTRQRYPSYEVIYVDDCSTDSTGLLVDEYIQKNNVAHKIKVIHNQKRVGALENLYTVIHSIPDHKIVVLVDGDDWLAHTHVLDKLAHIYADPAIWMTYGQYKSWPTKIESFCQPYPAAIIAKNNFRRYQWIASHPRTFYAGLFKKIKREDLLWKNTFYAMAWDLAIMFPMLEMASKHHFSFISDILYMYNNSNPLNDHKTDKSLVLKLGDHIRSKKPYAPLDTLVFNTVGESNI